MRSRLREYALYLGGRFVNRRRGAHPRIKSGASSYVDKVSYTYDALGQLTRENNVDLNQTIVYTYDNGGNIKSKKIYAYTTATDPGTPTQTISYTYDSTWKDKLTNYNGTAITYDAIGNPLTYRNGMSFTWNGRQMATANLNGTAVTYKYDADGLRTTKQVGSTLYEYEYVGGQLVYEKRGDLKFYYRYNAMGELASIKRINAAGSEYTVYVVTNTRGDVEELRLANGSLYARYVYDSWGNVLHVYNGSGVEETNVNALSLQNPFRYRSYYYDAESGLYYLQSRYYDPVTDRFVSADSIIVTYDLLGQNLYAYCYNNSVLYFDDSGKRPIVGEGPGKESAEDRKRSCDYMKNLNRATKPAKKTSNTAKQSVKTYLADLSNAFEQTSVINAGFGMGKGFSAEFYDFGMSAVAYYNPINVEISNADINFYGSVYIGGSITYQGCEVGFNKHYVMDWETGQFFDLSENVTSGLMDLGFEIAIYNGLGSRIKVGFEELY